MGERAMDLEGVGHGDYQTSNFRLIEAAIWFVALTLTKQPTDRSSWDQVVEEGIRNVPMEGRPDVAE